MVFKIWPMLEYIVIFIQNSLQSEQISFYHCWDNINFDKIFIKKFCKGETFKRVKVIVLCLLKKNRTVQMRFFYIE